MIVLIVDDSLLMKERLTSIMFSISTVRAVHFAQNPGEVDKILESVKPNVAIIDIHIPQGSGFDVLNTIRERSPQTTLIMLTNYPYEQYKKRALELGAHYFFDKCGEIDEVVNVIRKLGSESSNAGRGQRDSHNRSIHLN